MNLKIEGMVFSLFFLFISTITFADTRNFATLWFNGNFIGSLSKDEKWKYYLRARLVLIDDRYGFDEGRIFYGVGYQISPDFAPYVGAAYFISENTQGVFSHENVVWQQFLWDIYKSDSLTLNNRTALEERKNTLFSRWAIRLREQFTLKIPLQNTTYSFITFNELFFNLNYPLWVSNKFFSQNRYFIGLEKSLSKTTSFDFGYINQARFQRQNINLVSHGLYLRINVKS